MTQLLNQNVSFSYFNSDMENFNKINLKIAKNKHTIITGPNGSGKSTFLGLISGFFILQRVRLQPTLINMDMLGLVR